MSLGDVMVRLTTHVSPVPVEALHARSGVAIRLPEQESKFCLRQRVASEGALVECEREPIL